ncbi:MAG: bacillithiol biosynthesis cysteine-adding enzyme BshC [Acidobacteria bacterium]|nr:bacillithiol biosynthesis cysteine-adding enzyme BshC [Acidobacteriota bacterium]
MESSLLLSQIPHTAKLYSDFLMDFGRVGSFYSFEHTLPGAQQAAKQVDYSSSMRSEVLAVLRRQNEIFGADESVRHSLNEFASGAVAVVTGQQVGLFGGPAFSFYKALTAIHVAETLRKSGTKAVPIFWLATEDHDLAEISHVSLLDGGGRNHPLEWLPSASDSGRRVGHVKLGEGITGLVEDASKCLGGEAGDKIIEALRSSYQPDETFGSAFGKLIARMLQGRGLVLLDPMEPQFHQLAAPLFERAIDESAELNDHLLSRGKALEKAGYHAQVKVTGTSTLLFLDVKGQREAIRLRNEGFQTAPSRFTLEELKSRLRDRPEDFSANALFRPVMQDFLLPTAAYIGGPAEVAYFAQSEVLYRRMLGRMPAVLPRASFTLVEQPVARLLAKYGLEVSNVLRGRQRLRAAMERNYLSKALAKRFGDGDKQIKKMMRGLRAPVKRLDATLVGALSTAERKMLYQFDKLRSKAGRAANLRNGVLDRHEGVLLDSLYPHHGLQERSTSLLPFLARHGIDLLDRLELSFDGEHRIVEI